MAWCDSCDVFVEAKGERSEQCSACGTKLDVADAAFEGDEKPPWHFWLIFVALCGYLLWRAVEFLL